MDLNTRYYVYSSNLRNEFRALDPEFLLILTALYNKKSPYSLKNTLAMKKLNPTMVTISWIVTIVFVILLLISWGNASKIQTPYGSPASSPAYILGMLIGHGLIPGILWLITYFTAPTVNNLNNQKATKTGYNGGYSGGHNNDPSSNDYSGGYDGGHNNSNNDSAGYNKGDLYK